MLLAMGGGVFPHYFLARSMHRPIGAAVPQVFESYLDSAVASIQSGVKRHAQTPDERDIASVLGALGQHQKPILRRRHVSGQQFAFGHMRFNGKGEIILFVQLVDAKTATHLWAERFEKPIANLFDMQDEIVSRLANTLDVQFVVAEAGRAERSLHPNALDLTYQGLPACTRDRRASDVRFRNIAF